MGTTMVRLLVTNPEDKALLIAAKEGDVSAVNNLIELGADVNVRDWMEELL